MSSPKIPSNPHEGPKHPESKPPSEKVAGEGTAPSLTPRHGLDAPDGAPHEPTPVGANADQVRALLNPEVKTEVISNGSKWAGESPDPLDDLFARLGENTLATELGPFVFDEGHGSFAFRGNFRDISGVFNVRTNDPEVVARLQTAIQQNVQRGLERIAQSANARALEKAAPREGWTFEARLDAARAHARACLAYREVSLNDPDWTSFSARQRDAHQAALERHLVGLHEASGADLRSFSPERRQAASERLEEARKGLLGELPEWLAQACGAPVQGGLVTLQVLPNGNLKISLNPGAREEVEDLAAKSTSEALGLLLEDFVANGDLDWIQPEEIGALTDAPIVAFSAVRGEENQLLRTTTVYWHERYQVEDPIQELLKRGEVIFDGAVSEMEPEADPA